MSLEYPQLDRAALDGVIEGIDASIAIVQQSLDTLRYEAKQAGEDGPGASRYIQGSIAAREHVIALLTGYRTLRLGGYEIATEQECVCESEFPDRCGPECACVHHDRTVEP